MNWITDFYRHARRIPSPPIKSAVVNNPFAGKRLSYLIGADKPGAPLGRVLEVGYDVEHVRQGDTTNIAYCNLFNEKYSEQNTQKRAEYGPYLRSSDTAKEYNEGQIDPAGAGWNKNLIEQFVRRKAQGFQYIELDNCDAYDSREVLGAYELAASYYGFKIIAKNPAICKDGLAMVEHPAVVGIIVERDCGLSTKMESIRVTAGKPRLPVWFVCFDKTHATGPGWRWGHMVFNAITREGYSNMFVTWSRGGEYINAIDF